MLAPFDRHPSPAFLKRFGWTLAIGLTLVGGAAWYWHGAREDPTRRPGHGTPWPALTLAAIGWAVWVASRMSPEATRKIYVGWMTVTRPIGMVMIGVIFTLIYVIVLPIFALMLLKSDPLNRFRKTPPPSTYWEPCKPHEPTLRRMSKPF